MGAYNSLYTYDIIWNYWYWYDIKIIKHILIDMNYPGFVLFFDQSEVKVTHPARPPLATADRDQAPRGEGNVLCWWRILVGTSDVEGNMTFQMGAARARGVKWSAFSNIFDPYTQRMWMSYHENSCCRGFFGFHFDAIAKKWLNFEWNI